VVEKEARLAAPPKVAERYGANIGSSHGRFFFVMSSEVETSLINTTIRDFSTPLRFGRNDKWQGGLFSITDAGVPVD
jgi:hypothetical protein